MSNGIDSSLNARMNEGIDKMIAQLEQIKYHHESYLSKVKCVEKIAEEAKNYADFWEYKLTDLAKDWATD
jgi:hypothetical protein